MCPNDSFAYYRAKGLEEEACYRFYNRALKYNLKDFGGLVNMVAPIHIRQDSLVEAIAAKLVKLDGETEDCLVGYGSDTRVLQDFGSRMYFMEKV